MRAMLLLIAGLAAACSDAGGANGQLPADGPALPADAAILDGAAVPAMLRQCSRAAPAPGEGTWQPAAADILAFEAALPAELAAHRFANVDWSQWPQAWSRQYVGILRGGGKFIYGNFVPRELADNRAGSGTTPRIICDGGPVFFGAEYDVAARRVTHIAFNGGF
jgi:hypothetical protein